MITVLISFVMTRFNNFVITQVKSRCPCGVFKTEENSNNLGDYRIVEPHKREAEKHCRIVARANPR
jgi:hypothetical protein